MKKTVEFSQTASSQFRGGQQGYRTLTNFTRGQYGSLHADDDRYGQFHSESAVSVDLVRQLVQVEMVATLQIIKTQIEAKVNSIDDEIRKLRQEIFKVRDSTNYAQLNARLERLEKASATLNVPEIIVRDRSQPSNAKDRPLQSEHGMVRDKSERSLSKERKPIFPKGESSLNLSNILFPDEESQRLMKSRLEYKEDIETFNEPKFDEHLPVSKVDLPRSFEQDDKSDPVIHELVQELNCNKNKFLRNKSQKTINPEQSPTLSAGAPALPIIRDANLTIPEQEHEESILESARKFK